MFVTTIRAGWSSWSRGDIGSPATPMWHCGQVILSFQATRNLCNIRKANKGPVWISWGILSYKHVPGTFWYLECSRRWCQLHTVVPECDGVILFHTNQSLYVVVRWQGGGWGVLHGVILAPWMESYEFQLKKKGSGSSAKVLTSHAKPDSLSIGEKGH